MPLSLIEYRVLAEQAPIMIWRAGADGSCDYFNERWLAFTGRTMEQERGDGWCLGVHPDDLPACLAVYRDALRRGLAFEMEYRLRRADGAYRWIFDRGVPFERPQGGFAGYIGSCVDVTSRVEAERELEAQNEAHVRRLHGLLPICSSCKKIRDDSGYWHKVEKYITEHSEAVFTHSLCDACLEQLYPEVAPRLAPSPPSPSPFP